MIKQEVAILHRLDHPNIVKYYETYDDKRFLYLVMEHIDGTELLDKITSDDKFNEKEAASYMK